MHVIRPIGKENNYGANPFATSNEETARCQPSILAWQNKGNKQGWSIYDCLRL